ncbi:hypothetical protein BGX30_013671 [Mortierella sp. GBA39]|nr:hypothetical protein BGX30_013671 [Mortierella sp. GBA39]
MDCVILELDFVPTPLPPTDEHTSSSSIPPSIAPRVATRRIKKEFESVPAPHSRVEEPKVEKKTVTRSSTAAVEAHRPTETPIPAPVALGAPGVQIVPRPYSIVCAVQEQ